jgi:hypothetical protein
MSTGGLGDDLGLQPGEELLLRLEDSIEGAKGSCVIYFTTAGLVVKPDPAKANQSIRSMKRFPLTVMGLFIFYTMVASPLLCSMFAAPLIQFMPESTLLLIIRGVGIGLIALILFLFVSPIGEKSAKETSTAGHVIRHADIKKASVKKRTIEYPALSYSKLSIEMADRGSRFEFGVPIKHFDEVVSVLTKVLTGKVEVR